MKRRAQTRREERQEKMTVIRTANEIDYSQKSMNLQLAQQQDHLTCLGIRNQG